MNPPADPPVELSHCSARHERLSLLDNSAPCDARVQRLLIPQSRELAKDAHHPRYTIWRIAKFGLAPLIVGHILLLAYHANVTATAAPITDDNENLRRGKSTCWLENMFGPVPPLLTNVSQHMCRHRAVTNMGNKDNFNTIALRLSQGLPVNVVVFGGSVCMGQCVGRDTKDTFVGRFLQFLETTYPTKAANTHHTISNLCKDATGTNQAWEAATKNRDIVRNAHIFLVDKGSNDIQESELTGTWLRPGHTRGSDSLHFWTEALVRELRTSAPNAALLWVETAWREWYDSNCQQVLKHPCVAPFHRDASHAHLQVLEYYDVMQISMLRLLGPLGSVKRRTWVDQAYFCDHYHPNKDGHMLIASTIGQALDDIIERKRESGLLFNKSLSTATTTSPINAPSDSFLPIPITMKEEDLKFLSAKPQIQLDLTDPSVVNVTLSEAGAWSYATDIPSKPKTLMTSSAGTCATLNLGKPTREIYMLRLNLLFSYEGFGIANVELVEQVKGSKARVSLLSETINCKWTSRTSQVSSVEIKPQRGHTPGSNIFFKVCLDESSADTEQKLKLFALTLY